MTVWRYIVYVVMQWIIHTYTLLHSYILFDLGPTCPTILMWQASALLCLYLWLPACALFLVSPRCIYCSYVIAKSFRSHLLNLVTDFFLYTRLVDFGWSFDGDNIILRREYRKCAHELFDIRICCACSNISFHIDSRSTRLFSLFRFKCQRKILWCTIMRMINFI